MKARAKEKLLYYFQRLGLNADPQEVESIVDDIVDAACDEVINRWPELGELGALISELKGD